jgi:hypothetical protein
MDEEFDRRWRAGLPPFDGVVLRHDEYLPLPELRRLLTAIVHCLDQHHTNKPLYKLKDWHEHDGYLARPESSSWQELQSMLSDDKSILAASTGDTYVSTAFFPSDRSFYLRIYVPDMCDLQFDLSKDCQELMGSLDLACSQASAEAILQATRRVARVDLSMEPAKPYFDRRCAG